MTVARCLICRSSRREAIDGALILGQPERAVAAEFGLAKSTVHTHRARCVRAAINEAIERRHAEMGDGLLAQLDFLLQKAMAVVERAERRRRDLLLLKAIGQSLDVLRFRADLTGAKPEPAPRVSYSIVFTAGRPVAVRSEDPPMLEAPAEPAAAEGAGHAG